MSRRAHLLMLAWLAGMLSACTHDPVIFLGRETPADTDASDPPAARDAATRSPEDASSTEAGPMAVRDASSRDASVPDAEAGSDASPAPPDCYDDCEVCDHRTGIHYENVCEAVEAGIPEYELIRLCEERSARCERDDDRF